MVVIAILASITIVSYNGVRKRAATVAVQTAVNQYGDMTQVYMLHGVGETPDEATYATDLKLPASTESATFDYFTNTARNAFCLSVTDTNQNISFARTQEGRLIEGRCVKNLFTNPSFEVSTGSVGFNGATTSGLSTNWAISGTNSVRTIPSTTSADSFARYGGQGNLIGLTPGQTYTVSATSRLDAAQTGTIDSRARRIVVYSWTGTTAGTLGTSTQAANAVGVTAHSVTFTVPATATGAEIRLYNGATNTASNNVYWDGVMLSLGSTRYEFRDGSSADWFWTGTNGLSTSVGPAVQ